MSQWSYLLAANSDSLNPEPIQGQDKLRCFHRKLCDEIRAASLTVLRGRNGLVSGGSIEPWGRSVSACGPDKEYRMTVDNYM